MKSSSASLLTPSYTDALERALGGIVAKARDELATIKAQAEAITETALARVAQSEARLREIEQAIEAKLQTVKDGAPGERGADGLPGRDGKDGQLGAPGRDGTDGKDGTDGTNGADGLPGRDGVDGQPGEDGRDGVDGAPGERGLEGPPGRLADAKEYLDGVHYQGAVVTYEGSTYQAIRDTGKAPPHEDWRCIARAGQNGKDGVSFRIRGTWSAVNHYAALDVVALGGASFVARKDNPGICPGDDWQLIAAQGKRGNHGERGAPGAKGDRGEPGASVIAVAVNDDGLLTLTNGDGTEVHCDLYPLLSRLQR